MTGITTRDALVKALIVHAIRWEFDRGGVSATAVCHALPGSDCRLTSVSCECEVWGEIQRREDGTIWHRIVDYGDSLEPVWHEVMPMDDCNVCLFINESGCVEELGAGSFVIAETPIRPLWVDDGCEWERVILPGSTALTERGERSEPHFHATPYTCPRCTERRQA